MLNPGRITICKKYHISIRVTLDFQDFTEATLLSKDKDPNAAKICLAKKFIQELTLTVQSMGFAYK